MKEPESLREQELKAASSFTLEELTQTYEELQRLLALRQPPHIELLLCLRFLEALTSQRIDAWTGFGWEVAGQMARKLLAASLWGFSPVDLDRFERMVRLAQARGTIPGQDDQRLSADLGNALQALDGHRGKLLQLLQGGGLPTEEPRPAAGEAGVLIPVVERLETAARSPRFFADLRCGAVLALEVVVTHASEGRRTRPAGGTTSDPGSEPIGERPGAKLFGPLPGRMRSLFRDLIPRVELLGGWANRPGCPPLDQCVFSLRLHPDEARLDGESGGLAFLLAAASARASLAPGRGRSAIMPALAATGVLQGTRVSAVEPKTLQDKVEAAFFSPVRFLLVPASQEEEARAGLVRLRQSFPRRDLSLRGVSDMTEIPAPRHRAWSVPPEAGILRLDDVLICRSRGLAGALASFIRWLGWSRWRMATVLALAVSLVAILGWETYRRWPVPAEVRWIGEERIEFRNRHDVAFRQLEFSFRPNKMLESTIRRGEEECAEDLLGDGVAEVLLIHGSLAGDQDLFSILDWRGQALYRLNARNPLPERDPRLEDHIWYPFQTFPRNGGRGVFLVGRSPRNGWTSLFTLVSKEDGGFQLRGGLRNHGHLERFPRWDANGDGSVEHFALGVCNAALPGPVPGEEEAGRGLAVVLDLSRVSSDDQPERFEDLLYVTEPEALEHGVLAAWSFGLDRFSNNPRLHVYEADLEAQGRLMISASSTTIWEVGLGHVLYYFSGEDLLHPEDIQVRFSDGYKVWIAYQFRDIDLEAVLAEEEERLRREIMTLTPTGWKPMWSGAGEFSGTSRGGS